MWGSVYAAAGLQPRLLSADRPDASGRERMWVAARKPRARQSRDREGAFRPSEHLFSLLFRLPLGHVLDRRIEWHRDDALWFLHETAGKIHDRDSDNGIG